jgi:peptidyl-prolyl cis-trans isomerase SurA
LKLKFTAFIPALLIALAASFLNCSSVLAQGDEPVIVDQVIAQVNNDVITLSMVKREMKERIDALKQQGMTEQQAAEQVTGHQPELIALLINEQLLTQKGKELSLADEVEAEVNKRMLEVAKEQGITSIADLDEALKRAGLDPVGIRQTLRVEIMKQAVLSREVDAKLYYGFSKEEVQKYFDAHKDKFRKPESVTISEIFLSLAGKAEGDVRAQANQLVAQARGGADFTKLAATNSERADPSGARVAPQTGGKVGTFQVPNLREDIAAAIKDVKAGGVSEPLRTNDGYQILHVDERTPASNAITFNDNLVREAMLTERADKERQTYVEKLRKDAFVKINQDYRSSVEPLLNIKAETTPASTTATSNKSSKNDKNKSDKKDNKKP